MQRWGLIVLLCLLLVTGAVSDRYRHQEERSAQENITVTAPFNPQYTANQKPQSSVDTIAALTGIEQFSKRYHTGGAGQKIALLTAASI